MKVLINKIKYNPHYERLNRGITTFICFSSLFLAQLLKGAIVAEFDYFLYAFFSFQAFGSIFQGSVSDVYRRSTVLNFSLLLIIVLVFSLLFLHGNVGSPFQFLRGICLACIGLGGNVDVVGRAGAIDIHPDSDRRQLMSWTVFFEGFAWVVIGIFMRFLNLEFLDVLLFCLFSAVLLLLLSWIFNIDKTEDKKELHNPLYEIKIILKKNFRILVCLAYVMIPAQLGYFFFFYSQENPIPKTRHALLADSYLAWFVGLCLGCLILNKLKKLRDFSLILFGVLVSLISVMFYWFNGLKTILDSSELAFDLLTYGFAGFGSGIFLPCFYSVISKGHSRHVQGVLTGYVDSLRVIGDMITNLSLIGMLLFPKYIPILTSTLSFGLAVILTISFRKNLFRRAKV